MVACGFYLNHDHIKNKNKKGKDMNVQNMPFP